MGCPLRLKNKHQNFRAPGGRVTARKSPLEFGAIFCYDSSDGALAQLIERSIRIAEVASLTLACSTIFGWIWENLREISSVG